MTALRFIDLVLLWLSVPLVLVLGAPALGVLVGAAVWTLQRVVAFAVDRRARDSGSASTAIGLNMATMFVRMWLMAAAIVVAGVGGQREDGVAAAAILLVAFTVWFATTLLMRWLANADRHAPTPRPA